MAEGRSGGVRWEETGSVVIYSIGFVKSQRKKSNTRESFSFALLSIRESLGS